MRKLTHLKKAISLAVAAAMAVSVCTTALADDETTATSEPPVAAQSAPTEESEDIVADTAESDEQSADEETVATSETEPAVAAQSAPTEESRDIVADTTEPDVQSTEDENEENAVSTQAADDNADKGYTVDGDTYTVTSQEGLDAVVADIADKENVTINLSDGEFTTKGKKITAKKLTIVGNGADTVYKSPQTSEGKNESGANYSFEDVNVTLKNLTIDFGSDGLDYNGFIRPKELTLDNCTVKGTFHYVGANKATFTNVTFDIPEDYAQANPRVYNLTAYNAAEYVFDGCTFNSYNGKFVNAFKEGKDENKVTKISFTNCNFNGTNSKNKSAVVLTDSNTWVVSFTGCKTDNVQENDATGSALYEFKQTPYNATTVTIDGSTVWQNNQRVTPVAAIGDTKYATLSGAFAAAQSGDTITLLNDLQVDSPIMQKDTKNITLDLGGHTLSRNVSCVFDLYAGTLTLANGTVLMENVEGTAAVWLNQTASLIVEKDAEITTKNNNNSDFAIGLWSDCTSSNVVVRGKLTGAHGLTINGLVGASSQNTIQIDGATIDVNGYGIYQAGPANTTVAVNESVIKGNTGIEIRAGKLTVNNSKISGNGEFTIVPNGGGTTTTGAGIAVAQHTTQLPVDVTVNGGEISGTYALYEANPQKNPAEDIAKVHIAVKGGKFNGPIYSEDKTEFVTGGYYTNKVDAKYIGKDLACNLLDAAVDGIYNYEISAAPEVKTEVIAPVVDAGELTTTPKVNGKTEDEVKDAVQETASNIKIADSSSADIERTIMDEAEVNGNKLNEKATEDAAKEALTDATIDVTNKDVTVVVAPKLSITPVAVVADDQKKEIGFDIKLTYDIYATTAENPTADNIVLKGDETPTKPANAVKLNEQPVKVENPPVMDITIPDVSILGITREEARNLYIRHQKDADEGGAVYYYTIKEIVYDTNDIVQSVTFTNKHGFSTFTLVADTRAATIVFDHPADAADASKAYTPGNVNDALPTAANRDGYRFEGWRINGEVYTELTDALLTALNGQTVNAYAVYTEIPVTTPTPSPAPTQTPAPTPAAPESTATPAPTQKPAAPAADNTTTTATPAPTKAPASDAGYYTCKECGHHDWVATADGYKCTNCGHLESVKQLSGYKNVKGVYEPKTSAAKAAKTTGSVIPQTSDDMPIVPIAIVAIAALLGLCVTVVLKKKHN